MNKIKFTFLIALFIISCGQQDNKKATAEIAPDNHLYYLSIGNGHYEKSAKSVFLSDIPGIITSARYVSKYLSCYGKGVLLTSLGDQAVTKKLMMIALDSIINIGMKDSLSTTFIYYCGHGFSDNAGNVYLVPGDYKYDESNSSIGSLVTVNDIQQKIIDATSKAYASDPSIANGLRRPRFVILVDGCTEGVNNINYSGITNQLGSFAKNDTLIKKIMRARGNRTIYTASVGKLAPMIVSPIDKDAQIGSLCRRLTLFFSNNQSFNLAELLTTIANAKFDPLSVAPTYENINAGMKVGRDSVMFVCDKK